ncbi:MAG: hypoxanthine phosphoribosyltransferase [Defluviitaleaceae bacterium]|nr:hypoxanthine phosphoribosyltransferase [Defluviitaleaceae bacterium]
MDRPIKILISEDEIAKRVEELAGIINSDYLGKSVKVICVLSGGVIFMSDLIKCLDLDIKIDFISVSSYGSDTKSSGNVKITRDIRDPIEGEHVLLVEDIVDSGLSLYYLKNYLLSQNPESFKVCTLLDKPQRRENDVAPDYIGFTIPNEFVIGYGLDYNQYYRNLPYVGILPEELI